MLFRSWKSWSFKLYVGMLRAELLEASAAMKAAEGLGLNQLHELECDPVTLVEGP